MIRAGRPPLVAGQRTPVHQSRRWSHRFVQRFLHRFAHRVAARGLALGLALAACPQTPAQASSFSELHEDDWSLQALQNLAERYGCIQDQSLQSLHGGSRLTRYDAAALLNSCLPRINERTDQLKHLLEEFADELALLKDKLTTTRSRLDELSALQFSPTTRLRVLTRTALGAVQYSGNQIDTGANTWGKGKGSIDLRNAATFNYDIMMFVDTSTTGKDLLRTILRVGNFGKSAFGVLPSITSNPVPLAQLDEGFEEASGGIGINRLYYLTEINRYVSVAVGPRIRQNDALPVWPTIYAKPGTELLLKIFTQAGAPSAYTLLIGPGGGLIFKDHRSPTGWSAGFNYIATDGLRGDSSLGGIGTAGSAATAMAQASYTAKRWNISLAASQNGPNVRQDGTNYWRTLQPQSIKSRSNIGNTQALSVAGYWQPLKPGLIPTISAGYGVNQANISNSSVVVNQQPLQSLQSAGWMVGLNWDSAFQTGNQIGFAAGQPTFVTAVNGRAANDGNYVFELYYKILATNNIIFTPAIFYLSKPRGEETQAPGMASSPSPTFDALGALLEITLKL